MRDWIYTQEQAAAIKAGNIDARTKFYTDNLDRIDCMAKAFLRKRYLIGQTQYDLEDIKSQVYLDLPYLNFATPAHLTYHIKKQSFPLSVFGGYSFFIENHMAFTDTKRRRLITISLDQCGANGELDENASDTPFIECMELYSPSIEEEIEKLLQPDYSADLRRILNKYLTPQQAEFMALDCEGYSQAEARRKIGVANMAKNSIINKLRKVYRDILSDLEEIGCEAAEDYMGIEPSNEKRERQFKLSTEERAKRAAWIKAWRDKKKAGIPTLPRGHHKKAPPQVYRGINDNRPIRSYAMG